MRERKTNNEYSFLLKERRNECGKNLEVIEMKECGCFKT